MDYQNYRSENVTSNYIPAVFRKSIQNVLKIKLDNQINNVLRVLNEMDCYANEMVFNTHVVTVESTYDISSHLNDLSL